MKIEVLWKDREEINVTLKADSVNCETTTDDFCARHDNQESCESSCGIKSENGRCKWRPYQGFDLISNIYSTCVPDLKFCGDHKCDSLEAFGSSLGFQICPQDCTNQVLGNVNTKSVGISSSSKINVCTCDNFGDCMWTIRNQ